MLLVRAATAALDEPVVPLVGGLQHDDPRSPQKSRRATSASN
jgi:hypothetical protein